MKCFPGWRIGNIDRPLLAYESRKIARSPNLLRDTPKQLLYVVQMSVEFWAKLDAYLFKFLGLALGAGGLAGLLLNNPIDKVLHSTYGVILVLVFGLMGGYSFFSLVLGVVRKPE